MIHIRILSRLDARLLWEGDVVDVDAAKRKAKEVARLDRTRPRPPPLPVELSDEDVLDA